MHGDERFTRFFAYFNLFAAAMLVLVLGNSYLVTFLGWEGVASAPTSSSRSGSSANRRGGRGKKAFVANRIGDFGFMIAMFLIFATVGTPRLWRGAGAGGFAATATAIALLLFLGASARGEIPLYVWLPDAMEGRRRSRRSSTPRRW